MKQNSSDSIFLRTSRKGQLTLTFNWIYVLIAGGVILLFFVGIVVKQKSVSEQQLQGDVVRILESILTGATVSEQTKNFIDVSGLRDFTIEFVCELDSGGGFRDVFSHYGIQGTSATIETPIEIIFAPNEIKTTELIVWSMPYDLPFKIMDFLFVTSRDTHYVVIGNGDPAFKHELENATGGLNIDFDIELETIDAGDNFHTRIIDLGGSNILPNSAVPEGLKNQNDASVSAVSISTGGLITTAQFFSKKGDVFIANDPLPTQIVSIAPHERDAAKFGALFSGSQEAYECTMMKAFKRVAILSGVYLGAQEQIMEFIDDPDGFQRLVYPSSSTSLEECSTHYTSLAANELPAFKSAAEQCVIDGTSCLDLREKAKAIQSFNQGPINCINLY
jgi:hypothetical protein